jgi:hypothetical protein
MGETRKLAAILVADVVGYSRLAGADEDRTLARLRGLRSDLIDPAIAAHHGRIVKLSQSDTPEGLKQAIEGRIRALANVHSLFVQTRWIGAELSAIARQELAPYFEEDETRARINGPQVLLEPNVAQSVAVILHELATNAAKYGSLSLASGRN